MQKSGKKNYMTVPAAIRELEKIELIRQSDRGYRMDYAVTATQKEISAKVSTAANLPHPIVIVPSISPSFTVNSSRIFSSRSMIYKALRFNNIPASVSVILRLSLIKRAVPSSSSNAANCLDSVGCVIFNCSVAFVKFCSFDLAG